jgi:hypothetical protein
MAPTSLPKTKVVSLHLQSCSGYCPNATVCYHTAKNKTTGQIESTTSLRFDAILNHKVHESICATNEVHIDFIKSLLINHSNFNITLSSLIADVFCKDEEFKEQIQVSVYNDEQIKKYKNYQKLFLVKDHKTLLEFYTLLFGSKSEETGRLHFLFDQEFIKNRSFPILIQKFQESKNKLITLDTCFSSWIINGHCPYDDNSYIDISIDETIRKCPYEQNGTWFENLSSKDLDKAFDLKFEPRCVYQKIFKGDKDGKFRKDSCNKSEDADNEPRSGSGRVRRLSLRS